MINAWRHLVRLEALWTTPYGNTLMIKLVLVMAVLSMGAWNWRRMTPRIRDSGGANALARSARKELALAALVLAITAVLLSLPSPRSRPPGISSLVTQTAT